MPRLDHPFPSWSFIWVKESIVFAARVMEQSFTWMNGWFDLSQGREAPAREASGPSRGSPRCVGVRGFPLSKRRTLILRRILIASAAAAMLLVTFQPDDAFARRGGGMRAGGFHGGGAMRAGGYRGSAIAVRGYRGGAVAVRGGRVAGGYGYRGAYRAGTIAATVPVPIPATATVSVRRLRPRRLRQLGLPERVLSVLSGATALAYDARSRW